MKIKVEANSEILPLSVQRVENFLITVLSLDDVIEKYSIGVAFDTPIDDYVTWELPCRRPSLPATSELESVVVKSDKAILVYRTESRFYKLKLIFVGEQWKLNSIEEEVIKNI